MSYERDLNKASAFFMSKGITDITSITTSDLETFLEHLNKDFGPPPLGSFWRIDLPVGMTVQLGGRIRHLIFYRVLEHLECDADAMPTPFTGCYAAEVRSDGASVPVWNFQ